MMLEIPSVLDPDTLTACQDIAARDNVFVDGQATAGWHSRDRKNNLQGGGSDLVTGLLSKVESLLLDHELIRIAARPRNIVRLMLSRYDQGMYYGNHVDDAHMDGQRTDLSFTVFLSPRDSYEGGELVIDQTDGERWIKLEAGSMILYPSTSLHRVEPVTKGTRTVVVGWIRSYIRDAQQREILFDLDRAAHALRQSESPDEEALSLILKSRSNLLRLWSDG